MSWFLDKKQHKKRPLFALRTFISFSLCMAFHIYMVDLPTQTLLPVLTPFAGTCRAI